MNRMFLVILPLLLSPALALDTADPQPRASNVMTIFLNKILNKLFDHLETNNLSFPLVDLEEAGNFSNVEVSISGLSKSLEGYKSHGFKLNLNATPVLVGGKYNILHLDIPGLFPVFGKGDFSIQVELINLKTTVSAVRNFNKDKFDFTMPELLIRVPKAKVKFDNLMNDPHLADFLNELISNLIPPLVNMIVELLKDSLVWCLDFYGNGVFDCLKLVDKNEQEKCFKNLFDVGVLEEMAATFFRELSTHI